MNIGFHSLPTATESRDSVSSVAGRSTRGRPVAAVRRRRPHLSAPTSPLGRHDATPRASQPHIPPQRSLLSASSLASSAANQQLRPSSPPRLRPSQPAKSFARTSSTLTSPPWPLSGAGKAALPSSEPFFLAGVPPELTGDVAGPPYSTISSHFCS